jgi:peptide deformylase
MIEGRAEGFLARVIQHEIDHLDGKLFTDLVAKDKIITTEEYKKIRAEMAEKANRKKE